MEKYLGHDANYWLELERKAVKLEAVDFLEEIAKLRGKVSYYESRIKEINEFMIKTK